MRQIEMEPGSIVLPLPDDDYITRLERGYRIVLPEDYKEFLKSSGGGRPVGYQGFCGDGRRWAIDRFLCLTRDYRDNPLGMYDLDVTWSQLSDRMNEDPDGVGMFMVPVVVLFAGDFLCLDYRGCAAEPRTGPSVVVWLHDESDILAPVTRPVCGTFTEFLDLITESGSADG